MFATRSGIINIPLTIVSPKTLRDGDMDFPHKKMPIHICVNRHFNFLWEVLDSNQRPPPCQGDALNQLS